MVESIRNIWNVPDLRKRVLFTLAMLGVYRIGNHIPVPGINTDALAQLAPGQRPRRGQRSEKSGINQTFSRCLVSSHELPVLHLSYLKRDR